MIVVRALLLDHVDEGGYVLLGSGDIGLDAVEFDPLLVILLVAAHQFCAQLLQRVVVLGLG